MKKMIALTFVLIHHLGQLSFEQEHLCPHFNLNFFFVCVINWHSKNQFDQRLVNITVRVDFHAGFPNFINHFMIAYVPSKHASDRSIRSLYNILT